MENQMELLRKYIYIGFCQPKFYKRSAWNKANNLMKKLISKGLPVMAYDYGRGNGKYSTTGNADIEYIIKMAFDSGITVKPE